MAKATHRGTCQICGKLHKLPGGLLASHGYTVDHGFFNGTCWGSWNKPFEESKDLIELAIYKGDESATEIEGESSRLKDGALEDGDLAWQHICVNYRFIWMNVKVIAESKDFLDGSGSFLQFSYLHNGRKTPITLFGMKSLDDARRHLNRQYATLSLDVTAKRFRNYVKWQQRRIKDWKTQPLTEIEK